MTFSIHAQGWFGVGFTPPQALKKCIACLEKREKGKTSGSPAKIGKMGLKISKRGKNLEKPKFG